jgi:uncharacterized protein YraI
MKHKQFSIIILAVLLALLTVAAIPAQAQAAAWKVSYYNNIYLTDPPAFETTATEINFNWGNGSPNGAVKNNNWSARFGTDVYFTAATYRFTVRADDEVRLWIDNKSVINTIDAGQPGAILTVDVPLNGTHHLQVDYRERTGTASLSVAWQDVRTVTATPSGTNAPVTGITALVNTNILNVRSAPSTSGIVLTKINRGQIYGVVGKSPDSTWVKLSINGQQGWASAAYLVISNLPAVPVVDTTPVGINPTDTLVRTYARLNFRSAPATSASVLQILPVGLTLKVVARSADSAWLKVNYSGQDGWVARAFVQTVTPLNLVAIPVGQ